MVTAFIRSKVADFNAWKKMFDEMKHIRDAGGATNAVVYQSADNPNELTLHMGFPALTPPRPLLPATP